MRDARDEFLEDGEEGRLPEGLRRELKGMFEPRVGFDGSRDAGVLAAARGAGGRGDGAGWRRRVLWGAVAAAVAVAVGLPVLMQRPGHERAASPVRTAAYRRTGDIRDAFFLARELKRGGEIERGAATLDENGDGKLDVFDVRLLAMSAVRLDRGGAAR